jgi:urease accessory protein
MAAWTPHPFSWDLMIARAAATQRRPGQAVLNVQRVNGRSSVTSRFATSPLQLLTPRPWGSTVWACTSSLGGGLVAGDETSLRVQLDAGTRCVLGTQSSTKIYRNPAGKPCGHTTEAHLGPEACLAFLPDPIQPFAGASYEQRQDFHLAAGAGLVLVDWISSGRAARGERWAFARVQSRNQIFRGERRVLIDSLLLDPADGALDGPYRLGRFNCLALLVVVGEPFRAGAEQILERLSAQPLTRRAATQQSGSPLPEGAVLRLAGESVEDVGRALREHLALLSEGDNPWVQKW